MQRNKHWHIGCMELKAFQKMHRVKAIALFVFCPYEYLLIKPYPNYYYFSPINAGPIELVHKSITQTNYKNNTGKLKYYIIHKLIEHLLIKSYNKLPNIYWKILFIFFNYMPYLQLIVSILPYKSRIVVSLYYIFIVHFYYNVYLHQLKNTVKYILY